MNANFKNEWLVPAGLLALALVPILAGLVRLSQLVSGVPVTQENARFFADPFPAVLHIASLTVFCTLGAFQFAKGLRQRSPKWHRSAGRLLVPMGLVVALSGLWMTQFYPVSLPVNNEILPANYDVTALYWIRMVVG